MSKIHKLIYLNTVTGEHGLLQDGGIINAGGVSGPTFTVGGRSLLFSDGSPSSGAGGGITLQSVYSTSAVPAQISLTAGKHFIVNALNNKFFSVNAETGKVTIAGDLEVLGNSAVIDGTISNLDQVIINPPSAVSTAIIVEPQLGVTMTANLVTVRSVFGAAPVFSIDSSGSSYMKSLNVGLVNGVDVLKLFTDFSAHTNNVGIKHRADQVAVTGPFQHVVGTNVEEALASIDSQISTAPVSTVQTWAHAQDQAVPTWTIAHNKNSLNATVTVYDATGRQVIPAEVRVVDSNIITCSFGEDFSGRAVILLF